MISELPCLFYGEIFAFAWKSFGSVWPMFCGKTVLVGKSGVDSTLLSVTGRRFPGVSLWSVYSHPVPLDERPSRISILSTKWSSGTRAIKNKFFFKKQGLTILSQSQAHQGQPVLLVLRIWGYSAKHIKSINSKFICLLIYSSLLTSSNSLLIYWLHWSHNQFRNQLKRPPPQSTN